MTPNEGMVLDWELSALACSEEREIVMAHSLKAKAQPPATSTCWLTVGKQRRRIAERPQANPA